MRTKKMRVRGLCMLLAMVLFAGAFAVLGGTKVQAAKKKEMDKLKLNWDLKEGKTYDAYFNDKFELKKNGEAGFTIHNVKKKTLEDGNKQLSFTVKFKAANYKLTSEQIIKLNMGANYSEIGIDPSYDNFYFAVIDKATGLCLERENDFGVTVDSTNGYHGSYAAQKAEDGSVWAWYKYQVYHLDITYPADYKDLCIGIGYFKTTDKYPYSKYLAFWERKMPFRKSLIYKHNKEYAHFMSVE